MKKTFPPNTVLDGTGMALSSRVGTHLVPCWYMLPSADGQSVRVYIT